MHLSLYLCYTYTHLKGKKRHAHVRFFFAITHLHLPLKSFFSCEVPGPSAQRVSPSVAFYRLRHTGVSFSPTAAGSKLLPSPSKTTMLSQRDAIFNLVLQPTLRICWNMIYPNNDEGLSVRNLPGFSWLGLILRDLSLLPVTPTGVACFPCCRPQNPSSQQEWST